MNSYPGQSYINEGQGQLHNIQFYEEADSDHTSEVIDRINLNVHEMLHGGGNHI